MKIPGLFHLEETNKYLVHFLTRKRYACLLVHIFFSRIFGCSWIIFFFHVHIHVSITVCVVRIRVGSAIWPKTSAGILDKNRCLVATLLGELLLVAFARVELVRADQNGSFRGLINRLNASLVTKAIFFH